MGFNNLDLSRRVSSSVEDSVNPDSEPVAAQKFTRLPDTLAPPRPPKSSHVNTAAYLNLAPTPIKKRYLSSNYIENFVKKVYACSRGNENDDKSGQVETVSMWVFFAMMTYKLGVFQKVISDDMYDFPRSHTYEAEANKGTLQRRHCYNNAAPTKCAEGTMFHYDVSPKPSTSSITSVSPRYF